MVGDFTGTSVMIELLRRLTSEDFVKPLIRVSQFRVYPHSVRTDKGPKFTFKVFE